MTYNFDPDKWLENELIILQSRLKKGDLTPEAFDRAVLDLEKRHEEMWNRLDNSYRILPGE
jgi:hypothetical protein